MDEQSNILTLQSSPIMKWTSERSRLAHAAKAKLRIERAEAGMREPEITRIPHGKYLGTLQWHAADGSVRRWVIFQGWRANSIAIIARVYGALASRQQRTWTWLLTGLRKALSIPRSIHL